MNVVRNGVVFTPADIKGLLAEIYMYTDTEFLGGIDAVIHPAVFHVSLTNWLGRGSHPVAMEAAVGEVVVNYPIYRYKSVLNRRSGNSVEARTTVTYAVNTNGEAIRSPRIQKQMYFHYMLDVNPEGQITGGRYFNDSARIDMLWAPLQPVQGGQKGNERGNPHVDVNTVLAIWRDSVPDELRSKWFNIDPTVEDRILSKEEEAAAEGADVRQAATVAETPAGQTAAALPSGSPPAPAAEAEAPAAEAPAAEAPAAEAPAAEAPAAEARPAEPRPAVPAPTAETPVAASPTAEDSAPATP
jgi:hypothetical protein